MLNLLVVYYRVSIRRTDLCAFEPQRMVAIARTYEFQSVERICVPSNTAQPQCAACPAPRFNPSNGFVCLRTATKTARQHYCQCVSIRRTDLCAFEHSKLAAPPCLCRCFNPSNGFVCLRTTYTPLPTSTAIPSFNPSNGFVCLRTLRRVYILGLIARFQSVERICVPSNSAVTILCGRILSRFQSVERICVPSNRARARRRRPSSETSFNPSNGFVCLRTDIAGEACNCMVLVSIRRTDLCAFERPSPHR